MSKEQDKKDTKKRAADINFFMTAAHMNLKDLRKRSETQEKYINKLISDVVDLRFFEGNANSLMDEFDRRLADLWSTQYKANKAAEEAKKAGQTGRVWRHKQ